MKTHACFTRILPLIVLTILVLQVRLAAQNGGDITLVGQWAEGPCYTALLRNNMAVMNNGSYMVLIDLSDPANPVELSRFLTSSFINSITVAGDIAYIANDGMGLRIVDISDPAHPAELGFTEIGGFHADVVYHDGYIFHTTNSGTSLHIIDVSDPASPVIVQSVELHSQSKVAIHGNYMYVAGQYDGFQVYSIADIDNPDSIGLVSSMYSIDVTIYDNLAYVSSPDSLVIFDLSDPETPSVTSTIYPSFTTINTCQVQDGIAFITQSQRLRIMDVSNPSSPADLTQITSDRGFIMDLFVEGDLAVLASNNNGINIIDISDIMAPEIAGFYESAGDSYGVAVQGDFAYLANGRDGLRVLDISDPARPVEMSAFPTPDIALKVRVVDHYAYVANRNDGLLVLDISNPSDPVEAARMTFGDGEVRAVKVRGSTAFIALDDAGFAMVDISEPANPVKIDSFDTEGRVFDLAVQGDYVYLTAWEAGLRIVDISDPGNLFEVGYNDNLGRIHAIAVSGDHAYVGMSNPYVRVIDISDPADPVKVNEAFTSRAYSLAIEEELLYVSAGYAGVYVYDITDPLNLDELGYYNTGGEVNDIFPVEDHLHMADYNTGMTIVRFATPSSIGQEEDLAEKDLLIEKCFPTPFYDNLTIAYTVRVSGTAGMSIYDVNGHLVQTLLDAHVMPGAYRTTWGGDDLSGNKVSPGLYFIELKNRNSRELHSVILAK